MARRVSSPIGTTIGVMEAIESVPPVSVASRRLQGELFVASESHASVAAVEAVGDIVAFFQFRSNDSIRAIILDAEDLGPAAFDVGIYESGNDTTVDHDLFTSSLVSGNQSEWLDFGNGPSGPGPAHRSLILWEMLGLTSDPHIFYDMCVTYGGEPTIDGNITLTVFYTTAQ